MTELTSILEKYQKIYGFLMIAGGYFAQTALILKVTCDDWRIQSQH